LIDKTPRNFRQIGPEEFLPDGIAEELLPLIDTPEAQAADKVSLFYLTPSPQSSVTLFGMLHA
jgi:hypothetical protein